MPPGVKFTKEEIVEAALQLAEAQGAEAITARGVANLLHASSKVIFGGFANMEELTDAAYHAAYQKYLSFLAEAIRTSDYPPYKASGMAYIRFAKEEKALFRLLYMRDRSTEVVPEETKLGNQMENLVHINTGLEGVDAKRFHLEMWAFVHGVATMVATGFCHLDWELISRMLTDAYQGLKKQYGMEG